MSNPADPLLPKPATSRNASLTLSEFIAKVDMHLAVSGMSPGKFGSLAVNDHNFVSDLREGRRPGIDTVAKVLEFIERDTQERGVQYGLVRWNKAEDVVLTRLWNDRISHVRIAEIMGRTPSAVSGRAHRLGLPRRDKVFDQATPATPKVAAVPVMADKRRRPHPALNDGRRLQPEGLPPAPPGYTYGPNNRLYPVYDDQPSPPANQRRTRECSDCGTSFISVNFGVRRCDRCRSKEKMRFADAFSGGLTGISGAGF